MEDLEGLFLEQRPLLDVRAPGEFSKGAFPSAVNLPILDDDQRHQVGVCYKNEGPAAAEALGHKLTAPMKDERIASWQAFIARHPDALLYCFRGGMRSGIAQQWLREAGTRVERIEGGYKRLRTFLLSQFEALPKIILLSGKTGVGKTQMLPYIPHAVDLEGIANHRGSAFGKKATPQPSQIDFENRLSIELLCHPGYVVLEDESRLIGRISLPVTLQEQMKKAPICLLEDSLERRVERIHGEYVKEPIALAEVRQDKLANALDNLHRQFAASLSAIKKRLGGERYDALTGLLDQAFAAHRLGDDAQHKAWISMLLTDYYDPMYEYQLSKKESRIETRISWDKVEKDLILDLGTYAR